MFKPLVFERVYMEKDGQRHFYACYTPSEILLLGIRGVAPILAGGAISREPKFEIEGLRRSFDHFRLWIMGNHEPTAMRK